MPILLLTIGYSFYAVKDVKAKQAARREQAKLAADAQTGEGATAVPESAATGKPATESSNGRSTDEHGLLVNADLTAQAERQSVAWGRDPFIPPDKQGPVIAAPGDMASPRASETVLVKAMITDAQTGNSGVGSARLCFGEIEPFDQNQVLGTPPPDESGSGEWTFELPAPREKPVVCYILATDGGKFPNQSRSASFKIEPPAREKLEAQIAGADIVLTLRGVSWSGDTGFAIINRDIVGEGESIHGYEVVKINKNSVLLKRNEEEILLQLKE